MTYETALAIAEASVALLKKGEGNMSTIEVICHVAALDIALDAIAKRNGVTLPGRK